MNIGVVNINKNPRVTFHPFIVPNPFIPWLIVPFFIVHQNSMERKDSKGKTFIKKQKEIK